MSYADWIARYDTPAPDARVSRRESLRHLAHLPLISVLLPVYNPHLEYLAEAIRSVREQIYENWEICLVDDASTDSRVRPFLTGQEAGDERIRLLFRETNGHISAASNSALMLARGQWCALLDQDDALAENALAEVVCEINRAPEAGIIYSDEDFLDPSGQRTNPFFKPDWNPELFLGQNYLNHLGVYRTALLREIDGFREGFEGSQDYDLALRCIARLRPGQIRHIPRLLYRWRMAEGSLANQPDAKPYARHAARRALNSYLQGRKTRAHAEPCPENNESHRVLYEMPSPAPSLAIITGRGSPSCLSAQTLIPAEPGARSANRAAESSSAEILLFLSDQIVAAEEGWLTELISQVARPEVGVTGARLWSSEGNLEDGGLILGINRLAGPAFRGLPRGHPGYFNRAWLHQNFSAVSGACLAVRREVFLSLGGFDENNLPWHFYDIDFCLRVWEAGLQVVWTPYANLTFAGSGLRDFAQSPEEARYIQERWSRQLRLDPFYNPNLSLEPPGFAVASPPRL